MALSSVTLGTQLANMVPVNTEVAGVNNFATAWENYFSAATVTGVPVNSNSLSAATAAMISAMTGASAPGAGATAIQSGITAFWGVVTTAAATIWTTTPAIISATPPPTLSGIAAALTPVFAANVAGSLDLVSSANAIATVLHNNGGLGGVAVLGPPPPGGTPHPIL